MFLPSLHICLNTLPAQRDLIPKYLYVWNWPSFHILWKVFHNVYITCALGWALQHQVCDPNLYQLFFCSFWSIIWENIWVYRFRIDFEVSVIFFGSQCKIQGKIDAQIYFGHNFWQEGPTDLRSTPLSYIFDALFRDTPLGHVCRTQPNCQIAKLAKYWDIWLFACVRQRCPSGVSLKRA